mgnify:CR=1 FL=1
MAKKRAKEFVPEEIPQRADRDRRVRQAERLANILRILELVQSRGLWTTKALAEELECSERTVYRHLDVLKYAGVPYYREGSEHFVRVRSDYKFPIITLSEDEALGQALATAMTKAPGLDVGAGAMPTTRKLEASASGNVAEVLADAAQLVSVLDLKLADHSKHREAIRTVQFALLEERQIAGEYKSPYEPSSVRLQLHPYRLSLIKNAWYIIGRPTDSDEVRTYRVARFKTMQMLDRPADIPEDFNLKAYFGNAWAVFRGEKSYKVELLFSAEAALVVTETIWHHTQKVKNHKDGSVTLSFEVDGLEEITNWILGWAGMVKIIKPVELRERFVKKLETALEMNGG